MPRRAGSEMSFIDTNGTRLFYRLEGRDSDPTVVLSHALGANLEMWSPQIETLGDHFRILRFDTRGHGQSAVPDGPYSVEQLGRDAVGLLDTLGIERMSFCGMSMGSLVGMWLAANVPERVERLILAGSTARFGPPDALDERARAVGENGMAAVVGATLERWFTEGFRSRYPDVVECIRDMLLMAPGAGYVAALTAVRDCDFSGSLHEIDIPTLVLAGEHDQTAPPEAARTLADGIPDARLVILDAAHISNIEAPERFTSEMMTFLAHRDHSRSP